MHLRSIFQFDDYRSYLEHFYEVKKAGVSGYSYREFAEAADLGSANYLKLIISGAKNLTIANIHQFAKALTLTGTEYEYFEALVLKNQSKGERESEYYHQKLVQLKKNKPKSKSTGSMRDLISEWYYPALLISLDGVAVKEISHFQSQMAKRLGILESKVESAIQIFTKSEVVEIVDGAYHLEARHLYALDSKSREMAHKKFLGSQLQLSQKFLQEKYDKGAKFHCHTIKIKKESIDILNEKFKEYLSEVTALSDELVGDDLIQINAQIFSI